MPVEACIEAFTNMRQDFMAYSAAATSDYSDFAKSADPAAFAVDLGNYDMCMRHDFTQHCLAGSISKGVNHAYLAAFSGICVPFQCGPDELVDVRMITFLDKMVHDIVEKCSMTKSGNSCLLTVNMQQEFNYFSKLQNIVNSAFDNQLGFTCGAHRAWMTTDRWLFMTALGMLLLIVGGATIYQMVRDSRKNEGDNITGKEVEMTGMKVAEGSTTSTSSDSPPPASPRGFVKFADKVVDAFSLIKNVPYVFSASAQQPTNITASASNVDLSVGMGGDGKGAYGAVGDVSTVPVPSVDKPVVASSERFHFLDGMRTLSMIWIILGHTMTTSAMNGITNPAVLLPPDGMLIDFFSQLFMTSRFAVDTFFFISGFLVSISLLRRLMSATPSKTTSSVAEAETQAGAGAGTIKGDGDSTSAMRKSVPPLSMWLPSFYLHRILRILPPYAFCLLLWWKVGVLLGSGPFWMKWNQFAHRCDLYFWTNFLFVNNLHPYDSTESDQCFYVSWYLANDMQFYALSPALILAFLRSKRLGIAITLTAVVASCLYTYRWTLETGASAHSFDGANVGEYSKFAYTKPHFRFPPYGIGIAVGMLRIWQRRAYPRWKMPRFWAAASMVLACSLLLFLMLPASWSAYQNRPCSFQESMSEHCGSGWSVQWLAVYNSFTKPAWAIGLGIITLLCCNGQGFFISRFLSHRVWGPPAKLSFGVYLLHVTVLNLFVLSKTQKMRYSHFDFTFTFLAVVFLSFVLALFVAVFIESPACRISKQIENAVAEWYRARSMKQDQSNQTSGEKGDSEAHSRKGPSSERSRLV